MQDNINIQFGRILRKLRETRGYTQEEFATLCGMRHAYYIEAHKKFSSDQENPAENPYIKMSNIMPDFFKLYDQIETNMNLFYRTKTTNGRYGSVKGMQSPKSGQHFISRFLNSELDLASPNGFIYPILSAFRTLLKEENGKYVWKHDPFAILKSWT